MEPVEHLGLADSWGGATSDIEVSLTFVLRNHGSGGVDYFNYGNFKNDKLDALATASSKKPDPARARAAHQGPPALAV